MPRRWVLWFLVLTLGALGSAGCGGESDKSEAPKTLSGASGASGTAGPVEDDDEPEPRDRQTPVEAVEQFYADLNAGRYENAWDFLPARVQAESGGFDQWRAGYGATVSSLLESAKVAEAAGSAAVVAITLRAIDRDACTSERIEQVFEGSWTLSRTGDNWRADAIQLDKVSGSTPTLSASDCADDPPPPPPPPDDCTPGYSPCLTPASDYDCVSGSGDGPEYTGFVQVSGSDPYDLDADGDGTGCE